MDYARMIAELLPKVKSEAVLRRVWKILERAYAMQ